MEFIEVTLVPSNQKRLLPIAEMVVGKVEKLKPALKGSKAFIYFLNAPDELYYVKESYKNLKETLYGKCPPCKIEKFTHQGIFRSITDHKLEGFEQNCLLRETKLYWIDTGGSKYRKTDGSPCNKYPTYRLMLSEITKLSQFIVYKNGREMSR